MNISTIDVATILKDLNIDYTPYDRNKEAWIKCINPDHDQNHATMSINLSSGILNCFSCGFTGNIYKLVNIKTGYTSLKLISYLSSFNTGRGATKEEKLQLLKDKMRSRGSREDVVPEFTRMLIPKYEKLTTNKYLNDRGITDEEILKWGMGVITQRLYKDWIYIPLTVNGELVSYFLRDPNGAGKKYAKAKRGSLLAGIDFATDYNKPLYITEGIFDSIHISKLQVQSVAALSNKILDLQLPILRKYKKIVIVPDTDDRGLELVKSASSLIYHTELCIMKLPKNKKDAAECTLEELVHAYISNEVTYQDFVFDMIK